MSHLPKSNMMFYLLLPLFGWATANAQTSQFSLPPDPFPELPLANKPPARPTMPEPATPVTQNQPANTPVGQPMTPAIQEAKPIGQLEAKPISETSAPPPSSIVKPEPIQPPPIKPTPTVGLTVNEFLDQLKAIAHSKLLAINAPNELVVGQVLQFSVTSRNDCYLTVLGFSPEGQQMLLFPNRMQPEPFIRAGQKISVPPAQADVELALQGKSGKQTLVALCSPEKKTLYQEGYRFNARPFVQLHTGPQMDSKLSLAQPLDALGEWAVAEITVKNYRIIYQ